MQGYDKMDENVGDDGHSAEAACLNCGAVLSGEYCHDCGQHAHVHRTLTAFFHDVAHGVLHFEGKVWRTLPLLLWQPGELTRDYVEGKRARFVSPMALFLFSVFLMFAVLGMTGSISAPDTSQVRSGMVANVGKDEARLKVAVAERTVLVAQGKPTADIDRRIKDIEAELSLERAMASKGLIGGTTTRLSDDVPAWLRNPIEQAGRNPDLLLYKIKSSAYKWSWAIIPLSVPFLWLLFPFSRRFRLYDHLIFVTYSLSFMTLLVCVATLIGVAGLGAVAGFAMLVPPIHMYRQLRGAYSLSGWSALWRTMVLVTAAVVVLAMFFVGLVGVGLFD